MNERIDLQEKLKFCQIFEMPPEFTEFVDRLFFMDEIVTALSAAGKTLSAPDYDETWLEEEYHRGFINKTGNRR